MFIEKETSNYSLGIVGARNVKWLTKITASNVESGSHWQQNDYRMFSPSVDWDTAATATAPAIQVDSFVIFILIYFI
jgi:DMSO/TMAO reductase YedYZ molybdopterin-dependent catalytic subunit